MTTIFSDASAVTALLDEKGAKRPLVERLEMGMLVTGTVVYHYLEDWSWTTAFYFTVCTVTTVGYGDVVPGHRMVRTVSMLQALFGILYIAVSISWYTSAHLAHRMRDSSSRA